MRYRRLSWPPCAAGLVRRSIQAAGVGLDDALGNDVLWIGAQVHMYESVGADIWQNQPKGTVGISQTPLPWHHVVANVTAYM